MHQGDHAIKRIFLFLIFLLFFSGCGSSSASATETPDLQMTLAALVEDDSVELESASPQPLPDDQAPLENAQPTITPTVYVPEGQLYFYNFENVPVGGELELHPGIIFRKPDFGFEIGLTQDTDYYLGAGLTGEPDGNISVYALNISPPDETTALIGCRASTGDRSEGEPSLENGYVAEFRFDGQAKLKRIQSGSASVIAERSGVAVNSEGVYNQLYLLCDGTRLLFMVNANVVFDDNDDTLVAGDFLVGVKSNPSVPETTVRFDKIAVFEP